MECAVYSIDPKDIGRTYDADVIRVNSQSGKGGIGYILGRPTAKLPAKMLNISAIFAKKFPIVSRKNSSRTCFGNLTEHYLNLDSGI